MTPRETHRSHAVPIHIPVYRDRPLEFTGTDPLRALRVRTEELERAPKNQREKQVLAWWLRQRTTVGRRWMSQRLWMGEESGVTRAVRWVKANPDAELKRLKAQLLKGATE